MAVAKGRALRIHVKDGAVYRPLSGLQQRTWRIDMSPIDATVTSENMLDDEHIVWGGSLDGPKDVSVTGTLRITNERAEQLVWDAAIKQSSTRIPLRISLPPASTTQDDDQSIYGLTLEGNFSVISLGAPAEIEGAFQMDITLRVEDAIASEGSVVTGLFPRSIATPPQGSPLGMAFVGDYLYILSEWDGGRPSSHSRAQLYRAGLTSQHSDGTWRSIGGAGTMRGLAQIPGLQRLLVYSDSSGGPQFFQSETLGTEWGGDTIEIDRISSVGISRTLFVNDYRDVRSFALPLLSGSPQLLVLTATDTQSRITTYDVPLNFNSVTRNANISIVDLNAAVTQGATFRFASDGITAWHCTALANKIDAYTIRNGETNAAKEINLENIRTGVSLVIGLAANPTGSKMAILILGDGAYQVHMVDIPQ